MPGRRGGGAPDFDAAAWTGRWLGGPLPSFGGTRPMDLLDTMAGRDILSDVLGRIGGNAYA